MNAIHSPLDALAFDYAAFGFFTLVSSHWTWLALLTAALSLWKIRAKPHSPPSLPQSNHHGVNGSLLTGDERPVENFVLHETPVRTRTPAVDVFSAGGGDVDLDGVTRGKFTVYYEEDGKCESDEELTGTETFCDGVCGCESEWWEKWDKMLETKMGVKCWYMYQDLTDLNGNVVRFWD